MPSLRLAEDVYFAVSEGQGIFLDLKRDDYAAVPLQLGHPGVSHPVSDAAIITALEPYRAELLAAGLVLENEAASGDFQSHGAIPCAGSNIFHPDDQRAFGLATVDARNVRAGPRDVLDFWLACNRATDLLRSVHIHDIVRMVRSRKAAATSVCRIDEVRAHTAVFRKLRPWYPQGYLCLRDALALVEFLARRQVFAEWIFGVQAEPFAAHCWVQAHDRLLNESTEYAGQFTPIMIV